MFTEPPYTCLPIDDSQAGEARTYGGVRDALAGLRSRQPSTRLGAGVHSFLSVYQLFSCYFYIFLKPYQPIHEAQIYFVFCGPANPKALWANWAGKAEAL